MLVGSCSSFSCSEVDFINWWCESSCLTLDRVETLMFFTLLEHLIIVSEITVVSVQPLCPPSAGASVVMVFDGGGCGSRSGLPYCLRRAVSERSAAGVDHKASGGDSPEPLAASRTSIRPLDFLHDEHSLPQHGGRR